MFGLIKFIIEDLKHDWITLKAMIRGEAKLQFDPKTLITEFPQILKDNWLFFLIILLAFFSGWLVTAKYYQNLANQAIIDCAQRVIFGPGGNVTNLSSFNLSNFTFK